MSQPSEKFKLIPYQSYFKVYLLLKNKEFKPSRLIGEYWPKSKAFFRYVTEKQIYNKFTSIGFNYLFVSEFGPEHFELIIVKLKNRYLYTSRLSLLKHGLFELYSKNSLDLQIHMPLRLFKATQENALMEGKLIEQVLRNERSNPLIKSNTIPDPSQENLFNSTV